MYKKGGTSAKKINLFILFCSQFALSLQQTIKSMTMKIAIYTLTSGLHDEATVGHANKEFLGNLGVEYDLCGSNFTDYGSHVLDVIYVCTGGTEGIFRRLLPELRSRTSRPFYLLASGQSNSLAASIEILSFLRQKGVAGEIIHGSPDYVSARLQLLARVGEARAWLNGKRLGVIGQPSDWLIASHADKEALSCQLGLQLVDVEIQQLLDEISFLQEQTSDLQTLCDTDNEVVRTSLPGALRIYQALLRIVEKYRLDGLTIRCFDLLTAVHNTGCLALARLNAEGLVAGCEGDVPAMVSMMVARALTGVSGFQANPASINPETGEMMLAHCTIPLDMVSHYEFDTHFESGIGVGIRGYMDAGPVTIFKVAGNLSRHYVAEGTLLRCEARRDLCRTQFVIQLDIPTQTSYFLTNPIGNHHIVIPGHQKALIEALLE